MPTQAEPGQPHERPVLEPIRVLRPRNTDALAELFREMTEETGPYEAVRVPTGQQPGTEADTQELPPVGRSRPPRPPKDRVAGAHRVAIATIAVLAAALVGFACALLLPGRGGQAAAQTPPATAPAPATTPATASPAATTDPDGAGTLREGDTGPEVTDLQQRLRRIPNIYDGGPTDGRYDTVLTEAVARFQLWYGIRGDETGVYGDDTRRDLESRTG
ncbi:peptidoglycan-binding domain-containing protein [Streptomyces sp. NEAU-NA10]|uniref:peptidoglycan-binding domain-containing protein n=1 Tax=Streptomyces sp. NEAU-NA10 TaxID=3416050 RepID=UPI003CC67C32